MSKPQLIYITSFYESNIHSEFSVYRAFDPVLSEPLFDSIYSFLEFVEKTNIRVIIYIKKETHEYLKYQRRFILLFEKLKDNLFFICFNPLFSWVFNKIRDIHTERLDGDDTNKQNAHLQLPVHRNREKDTFDYIASQHLKHDLIKQTIRNNDFIQYSHFAWIDMTTISLIKEPIKTIEYFKWFSNLSYYNPSFITFPGCWSKIENETSVVESVQWRFCGGYFVGDRQSIATFCEIYTEQFPLFLLRFKTLTWDFCFWAWMEKMANWTPSWYKADHNDSLFVCSGDFITKPLFIETDTLVQKKTYNYPEIANFFYPMSACYLYDPVKDQHLLNTRYVNYWIYPNGNYHFFRNDKLIESKNVFSLLDLSMNLVDFYDGNNTTTSSTPIFYPCEFQEMTEQLEFPHNRNGVSFGLEDIRLFYYKGQLKFIASSIGYSLDNNSHMYMGNYNIENRTITDGFRILSPITNPRAFEKNWIPIVKSCSLLQEPTIEPTIEPTKNRICNEEEELYFIYKWGPFQIGKLIDPNTYVEQEETQLEIVYRYNISNPLFHKLRGSSPFVRVTKKDICFGKNTPDELNKDEYLLGIAHYSEEQAPRHYYHVLVLIDKDDFCPVRWSDPFYFQKLSIEFSIGFSCFHKRFSFWISQHDRDPLFLSVPIDYIPVNRLLQVIH